MSWTDAELALLKKCLDEDMSAKATMNQLGGKFSRNACIGKARRLGLKFHSIPARGTGRPTPLGAQARQYRKRAKKGAKPFAVPLKETWPEVSASACSFDEIKAGKCRWPLWATNTPHEEQSYCGALAPCGPYCLKHFALAYRPDRSRSRREPISSFMMRKTLVNA